MYGCWYVRGVWTHQFNYMTNIHALIHKHTHVRNGTVRAFQDDISADYIIDGGVHSFDKCDTLIAISERI